MLYAAPFNAASVLIVDPVANTTDTTTLAVSTSCSEKWAGIAFAPVTNKLYAAPYNYGSVLTVDPVANTTHAHNSCGAGLGAMRGKYIGIAYAPISQLLYLAPHNHPAPLFFNPAGGYWVAMDSIATGGAKYAGIAYSPVDDLLYAAPYNSDSVLVVDPRFNRWNSTSLNGLGSSPGKWAGIAFSPITSTLAAAPWQSESVLTVEFTVDSTVLLPFRHIAALNAAVIEQQQVITTQRHVITALNTSQMYCGHGTLSANNSVCIPDCDGLRRRSIGCEPYCTAAPTTSPTAFPTLEPTSSAPTSSLSATPTRFPTTSPTAPITSTNGATTTASPTADSSSALGDSGGGGDSSVGVAVGVTIVVLVVGAVVCACRRRAQRQHLPPLPPQTQPLSMYVNPLHLGSAAGSTSDYEEPTILHPPESPRVEVDSELYVADQRTPAADASYAVFRDVHVGSGVSVLREAKGVMYAIPHEGAMSSAPDYIEVSGDTAGTYAVFQSTEVDATV
eukprot:m.122006 g.122006  ORF g.122006 m.122006 type:complete len:504 (+) comp21932_c0_seq3:379-1890(+)